MYATTARYREAVARSHRIAVRVQLLSSIQFGPNPQGGLDLPVLSGDIQLSSTSDVKGSLDITVPGDYWESVQPYGAEIFAERGVEFGDGTREYVPLGYYRIDSAEQPEAPWGPVKISARDRAAQMIDARLVYPYQYPDGITHAELFARMINGYIDPTGGPQPNWLISYGMYHTADVPIHFIGYDGATATLPAGVVEDSIYEHLAKIADARACVLRFDRHGELRVEPRERAPGTASVFTVAPGTSGNLIKASRRVARAGVFNIVVARGSDPEQPTGYRLAYNGNPDSPIRWNGPFGAVPRYYASPLLRTSEGADLAAETILARYKGLPTGLAVVTVPDPSIDPLDPITVKVGAELQEHLADEVTIPLTVDQAVQIVTRTLNEVPTFEEEGPGGGVGNPTPGTGGGGTPGGGGIPGGGGTGAPVFAAKFRDGRAFPVIREPSSGQTVVNVSSASALTSALSAAGPGTTIVMADGTYSGSFNCSKSGSAAQPIVIKSQNLSGAKLAAGASFRLSGSYILLTGMAKDLDDSGKSFSIESGKFCRITRCRVGPSSLGAPDATAAKSLHFYVGGTAEDCVIDYCESRNKSKPGNGVLVDGNFSGGDTGGAKHILLAHLDIHDFGTEVVNDFEAIRIGVSTMQETVSNSAVIRCVFTNIASEPEVISHKLDTIDSWGHTLRNCVGSLSSRHGGNTRMQHSYIFGPATGAAGTKAGGFRLYDDDIWVTDNYIEGVNGSGFQDAICVDGGDTTTGGTNNGHKQVRRAKVQRNVLVNNATGITVGRNYSIAPADLTITDNVVVSTANTQSNASTTTTPSTSTSLSLRRFSSPDRTEVFSSLGNWLATFTDGARTVTLAGSPRTFTQSDVPIVDHFTRTRTDEWGPAPFGGRWLQGGGVDADFNVAAGVGTMSCTSANVSRRMRVGDYDLQDQDVTVKFTTDKTPAGAGQVATIMLGYQDLDNFHQLEVTLSSTSTNVLAQIRKRVAATVTTITSQITVSGLAHGVGTWFWIRGQHLTDGTIRMKVWADGTAEPGAWTLSGTDSTFPTGRVGVRAIANTGTTNLPVLFSWDDFTAAGVVTSPPTVTHSTWVRLLPATFTGTVPVGWLDAALGDTSPDILALAMQYIPGAPAVMDGSLQIAGDADYGPLSTSGSRVEGADFNDYLGIPWTYTGVDNPEPAEFQSLDCSGYMRMVWGYRAGLPLSLTATGSGQLPRVSRDQIDSGPGVFIVPRAGAQITDLSPLRIGDIVGFDATAEPGELDGEIDHLGIYLGQDTNGDYRFISSRKTPSGPSFSDTGGPSLLNGSNLYARTLRAVRRF
jgi:hypothetical protein